MPRHSLVPIVLSGTLIFLGIAGCDRAKPVPPSEAAPSDLSSSEVAEDYSDFEFREQVESNRQDDGKIGDLEFVDSSGKIVRLDQYQGKKNVLLVFTRGFSGQLCPFCTTQTSRLIANYDKFAERDTEVLLVYPGQKAQLGDFLDASMKAAETESFPFPVLLDEDLAAVNQLDIAAQLAFPSTFIIDKQGHVTLSYVGKNPTDRPSIKALLAQLDHLQQ